uniref:FH2 domain-containing protein n=1 Tax=Lates calcarifer TaxID=8187 RepID=A0A4W6BTR6_LATCA
WECLSKKKRVRSFFWKTIPEEQVKGRANLWTQGRVQQQYQIDVQTIEELFGQNDCQSNPKAPPTRGERIRSSFRETKEEVSVNFSCKLKSTFLFRSNQMIVDDIRHGNSEPYGVEPLRELLKLLPETEEVTNSSTHQHTFNKQERSNGHECILRAWTPGRGHLHLFPHLQVKKLKSYRGDVSKLSLADSFIYLLIQLPRLDAIS